MARKALDWTPRTPVKEGLARTIAYFEELLKDEGVRGAIVDEKIAPISHCPSAVGDEVQSSEKSNNCRRFEQCDQFATAGGKSNDVADAFRGGVIRIRSSQFDVRSSLRTFRTSASLRFGYYKRDT